MKSISIIYVYYNTPYELVDSINSLQKEALKLKAEIIIVDNNSPKKLPFEIKRNKKITLIKNKTNNGFGSALNQASSIAKGKYLLFLNPDTKVSPNFLKKLIKKMESDQQIGLLGVRYLDDLGRRIKSVSGFPDFLKILFSFSILSKVFKNNKYAKAYWMKGFNYKKEQEVPVVGGACMVVRATIFKKINGFDEQFFMYFEEADLARKIKDIGYKVLYFPDVTITHLVGRSTSDVALIKQRFEDSRYKILKKYEGIPKALLAEGLIRILTRTGVSILILVCISLFLNLYRIDQLMMFYGDFGRDFLAAREMIVTGNIPLRGIPSSVVWLHQGPFSIYLIGISLLLTNFNPVAPAILYALLGSASVYLVYLVGKEYFNNDVGFFAAALFATSPLVIINARIPYHTSPIPFFTLLLFLTLAKIIKGEKKFLAILFLLLGILFMLELSNSVLLAVILISLLISKTKYDRVDYLRSSLGFLLGISPFILFDLTNKFVQTGGFILWVINRVRLFLGIATQNSNASGVSEAATLLWNEINRIVFPHSQLIVILLTLCTLIIILYSYKKFMSGNKLPSIILLWLCIPLGGFLIHAKPGVAYTPVIFPAILLLIAYAFYFLILRSKIFILPLMTIIIINSLSVLGNNYYLTTSDTIKRPELVGYSYGFDLSQRQDVVNAILKNAKGNKFTIRGGGYLSDIETGVDNYNYLAWYKGGKINEDGKLIYRIYENKKEIKNEKKIIYQSKHIAVTKNE